MAAHVHGEVFLARLNSRNGWVTKILGAAVVATLSVASVQGGTALAQDAAMIVQKPLPGSADARRREEWRASIQRTPLPRNGCFTATYPATNWQEARCIKPPKAPFLQAHRVRPPIVGAISGDNSAQTIGTISAAVGSFDEVGGVTSEKDVGANNNYSLQLNTNKFTTGLCAGSANPMCIGWQQFIFANMPELDQYTHKLFVLCRRLRVHAVLVA